MYLYLFLYIIFSCYTKCIIIKNVQKNALFLKPFQLRYKKIKSINLNTEKQISDIVLYPLNKKVLKKNNFCNNGENKYTKGYRKSLFNNICSLINVENDEKTREIEELKINHNLAINDFSSSSSISSIERQEVIQLIEAYWLLALKNEFFFKFLKKKKNLIFSISSGVDSLSLLYSFIFIIYKILITIAYKDDNYISLLNKINNVYSYSYEDISNLISKPNFQTNFFFSILKNITVLYCNHKTRIECNKEKVFLKNICFRYNLKFKTKLLTKKSIDKLKNKNKNSFLLLARIWRRNSYIDVSDEISKKNNIEKFKILKKNEEKENNSYELRNLGKLIKSFNYTYKNYISDIDNFIKLTNKKHMTIILLKNNNKSFKKTNKILNLIKSFVFLGHNKNDNNETILFQLFRGVFIKNISGIKFLTNFKNCFLYRPFIKLNKIFLYKYMKYINKKWLFDKSNEKLSPSRNFLRNIVIPNISFILKDKRNIKNDLDTFSKNDIKNIDITHINYNKEFFDKNNCNKNVNDTKSKSLVLNNNLNTTNVLDENSELRICNNYIYPSLDKRLKNLLNQSVNLDNYLNYYNSIFNIYIKSKYYDNNSTINNIFVKEYMNMQNNLYNSFFLQENINHLIKINKIFYQHNFFLKIFNLLEFLVLPSKFIRIEILYNIIKKYTNVSLSYSRIEKIYQILFSFVQNHLKDTECIKKTKEESSYITSEEKLIEERKKKINKIKKHNKKIKIVNLNLQCKILVNNNFFRVLNSTDEKKKKKSFHFKDKSSHVFIHDDISAMIERINKKNIKKENTNIYLLIKKRKKKKKEKFNIHIRYLKKGDLVFYEKKLVKVTKFLSKYNIPYIYKISLPIIEITNFSKNNIIFFFLFKEIKNKNFCIREFIQKKNMKNHFIYSIRFLNNNM
ncbi:conserved Plasmodium protein, unknown function [Plasmodium gallinaceum]|uniref:tRNA(Ile)-lysidine/2-thiocytidine synthase N-terminal domain-containing protein n=1 Tax=Plasmodium gallinaceum TaxID=5849 RepID=A0A1J1H148_PLAGA|nr:conserved Plasmodium protein, unknown function [Plasmodium gallinaceum]CRG98181.1 conserved Plasmodium protein, unknown function [Plasmodium gallinaceum]